MVCTQVRFTQNVSSRVFSGQSYSRCRGFIGGYDLPNELSAPSLPPSICTWSPAITSLTVPSVSLVFGTLHLRWRVRYKAASDRLQIKFLLNGHEHLSPFSRLTFFYHMLFKNWAYGLSPISGYESRARSGCVNKVTAVYIYLLAATSVSNTGYRGLA
ncbi:hypothetical protein SCLCIDRAFT_601980 [Scleroderma citrinum Foug A]|uniref:Uncharacterized protein n=1 Tax=Scleroderma citrinum Foug A TaxID=1036808 RepID=A0A0C3E991_9AGAM|nr:hypothetical protein SCLCIDRAFT_601980 [Scleroderma citrinum Foug A]